MRWHVTAPTPSPNLSPFLRKDFSPFFPMGFVGSSGLWRNLEIPGRITDQINAADQPPLAHDKNNRCLSALRGASRESQSFGIFKGQHVFQLVDGFLISLPTGCCSVPRGGAQRD